EHSVAAGDVMAVFWACLIATSNLQMCIPQFIVLAKGKFAMSALLGVIGDSKHLPTTQSSSSPAVSTHRTHHLHKITHSKCCGELALHNVSFAYPSQPTIPVLTD